jgi:MFS family permease
VLALPLGVLSDRRGRKGLLIAGSLGIPGSLAVYAASNMLPFIVLATVIFGVAEASSLTTWNALIADETPPEGRNRAFSLSFIISIGGMGVGSTLPFVFPALAENLAVASSSVHVYFLWVLSVFSLLTPLVLTALLRRYQEVGRQRTAGSRSSNRLLLKFSAINSMLGVGSGMIVPLILTWFFLRFGLSDAVTGPVYTAAAFSIVVSAVASPFIASKLGQVRAIALTELSSTLLLSSLAFVPDPVSAAVLFVARSSLFNSATPLADSYLMGIVPPEQRGKASAINSIIWRLPNKASTLFGGILLQTGYLGAPFLLAGAIQGLATGLFYFTFRGISTSN